MKKLSALILSGVLGAFFSTSSNAALDCTQAPDCASLGYTMTAADCADSVKVACPTDPSKVFCKTGEEEKERETETSNVCTDEKWFLYLNFAGTKDNAGCRVKKDDSSIVLQSETGKKGSVTDIALATATSSSYLAWTNWAEIHPDGTTTLGGYIGGGDSYIDSFTTTCKKITGVEFFGKDSVNMLRYVSNNEKVKI